MSARKIGSPREFAVDVVGQLRDAGFEALWAGGCVRDQLLGLQPKDYDVATNATPNEVRKLFGFGRTLSIGAAFGVITVLGPKEAGQIEIATFREDGTYSDGRHPDQVTFGDAREDALRRDFTINGVFYDPLESRVLDFVGGQTDLKNRIVRAIGDPHLRISEDRLRMLRAIRFAATYRFEIESQTYAAIAENSSSITSVSAERITAEMRRMLTDANRARAITLLAETGLLVHILPELQRVVADRQICQESLAILGNLDSQNFATTLAALLINAQLDSQDVDRLCERWRVSNAEEKQVTWLLRHYQTLISADAEPWPVVQRVLTHELATELLNLADSVVGARQGVASGITFCRERLTWPREDLNPEPLINGDVLRSIGLRPGPAFKAILDQVRDAQLEGKVHDRAEALRLVKQLVDGPNSDS